MADENYKKSENTSILKLIQMLAHLATICISVITFILLVSGFFNYKAEVLALTKNMTNLENKDTQLETKIIQLENCKNEIEKKVIVLETQRATSGSK